MPPSLDTRGVNAAVRAVAGDRVKFCFPCAGEPAPEIRWVREGDGADGAEQGCKLIDTYEFRTQNWAKLWDNFSTRALQLQTCLETP